MLENRTEWERKVGVSVVPISSVTKKVSPMPTGARYVDLCLTTASMMMTRTSCAVRNISMKRPWAMEVPPPRRVLQFSGPGKRALTTPAEAMPATSWAGKTIRPRTAGIPPVRQRASVTCGVSSGIQVIRGA